MRTLLTLALTLSALLSTATSAPAQDKNAQLSDQDIARSEKAFDAGNALMELHKYAEALARYQEVLALAPKATGPLFNGGLAAYQSKDFTTAADLWLRLKQVDPSDWHARAKLMQAYQALGKLSERDAEHAELLTRWKSGNDAELSKEVEFCRDQFEANKYKVMAFEHFELTGERAVRYVFSILNENGDDEDWSISLGSYDLDNNIWRETTKPTPKPGERLFHVDGYFKGGHATYGMFVGEASYDEMRAWVVRILQGKSKPVSSSTVNPFASEPAPKPKP